MQSTKMFENKNKNLCLIIFLCKSPFYTVAIYYHTHFKCALRIIIIVPLSSAVNGSFDNHTSSSNLARRVRV